MKRRVGLLVVFVLCATGIGLVLSGRDSGTDVDWSKSVLGFAGPLRAGVFFIDEPPDSFGLRAEWGPQGVSATKHQPLVLKTARREWLIFARSPESDEGDELVVRNLREDRDELVLPFERESIVSTPILLAQKDELWSLSRDKTKVGFQPVIRMTSLRGAEGCRLEIDLGPSRDRLHCVTALAHEPLTDQFVFGCSLGLVQDRQLYRTQRGLTGLLVLVRRPLDRCPTSDDVRLWSPARVTEDRRSGYDTGIWMAGAAPLTPGDGSVWFTTGNGWYAPEHGNYGCSLLRLDLTQSDSEPRVVWAHDGGIDRRTTYECMGMNIEPSSSGVAFVHGLVPWRQVPRAKMEPWSFFLFGKDSQLKWARGDVRETPFEHRVGWYLNYGQPAVVRNGPSEYLTVTQVAVPQARDHVDRRWGPTDGRRCVGAVLRQRPAGEKARAVRTWFSGPYRMDRVLAVESSKAEIELTSERSVFADERLSYRHPSGAFPPYVAESGEIGWMPDGDEERPVGFVRRPFAVARGPRLMDFMNINDAVKGVDAGELWFRHGGPSDCSGLDLEKYVPLGEIQDRVFPELVEENRLDVHLIRIGGRPQLLSRWKEDGGEWTVARTSPALGLSPSGKRIAAMTLVKKDQSETRLLLIDPWSGRLLAEARMPGAAHFSMPVFYRDRVLVATRGPGRLHSFLLE